MMPVTSHYPMAASKLHRIIACPASFKWAQEFESAKQSEAAAEGEYMHGLIEHMIQNGGNLPIDRPYTREQYDVLWNAFDQFKQLITEFPPLNDELHIEEQHLLSGYDACLFECGGTCDVWWIDTKSGLHVLDWKFGRSEPISAESNSQLMTYAAGVLVKQCVETVSLHIVMPRRDWYDTWTTIPDTIYEWIDLQLIPAVRLAYEGAPIASYNPGEKQCQWCPGKQRCAARMRKQQQTADEVFAAATSNTLTIAEASTLLPKFDELKVYMKDIEKFVYAQAIRGTKIPGYKLIQGLKNRQWSDEVKALEVLMQYLSPEDCFESKLISPSAAEKLDRKLKKVLVDYTCRPKSNYSLVPESAKGEAVTIDPLAVFTNSEED